MSLTGFDAAIDAATTRGALFSVVGSFTRDALLCGDERKRLRERCEERLSAAVSSTSYVYSTSSSGDGGGGRSKGDKRPNFGAVQAIQYAEQAVLADLDWGIGALEEALRASSIDTKKAWLEHAEKMLQVCVLLNTEKTSAGEKTTAGVPNSYLAAWANLYLAFVWKLRNNDTNSTKHVLEMFLVDPLYSRLDFAPKLWEHLFLPHLTPIVAWFNEQRHQVRSRHLPDATSTSFSSEVEESAREEQQDAVTSGDQARKLQQLEQLYERALDGYTRLYARHYKDCLSFDAGKGRGIPMMPIAEPPATPIYELSSTPQSPSCHTQANDEEADPSDSARHYKMSMEDEDPQLVRYDFRLSAAELIEEMLKCTQEGRRLDGMRDNDEVDPAHHRNSITYSCYVLEPDETSGGDESPPSLANVVQALAPKLMSKDELGDTSYGTRSKRLIDFFQDTLQGPSVATELSACECQKGREKLQKQKEESAETDSAFLGPADNGRELHVVQTKAVFGSAEINKEQDNLKSAEDELRPQNHFVNDSEHSSISTPLIGQKSHTLITDGEQTLTRPPMELICPITGELFHDPVTLETGQTYERRAIQEWLDRGNHSCPSSRQKLRSKVLPNTNYVLKRLSAGWRASSLDIAVEISSEDSFQCQHLPNCDLIPCIHGETHSTDIESSRNSATSAISSSLINTKSYVETQPVCKTRISNRSSSYSSEINGTCSLVTDLKSWIACLCTSDSLEECESAVVSMAAAWGELKLDNKVEFLIYKPGVIDGMVEVLFASSSSKIQRRILYILSELICKDNLALQTLTNADFNLECISGLVKKGIAEGAIVLCQIKPPVSLLNSHQLLNPLINIMTQVDDHESYEMVLHPKLAALKLLEEMLGTDQNPDTRASNVQTLISNEGVNSIVNCLRESSFELRTCAASILFSCMRDFKTFRKLFVELSASSLTQLIGLLSSDNDKVRTTAVYFLTELLCSSRLSPSLCPSLSPEKKEKYTTIQKPVQSKGRMTLPCLLDIV